MMDWLAALEGSAFATWLRESGSIWAYPTVLTAHTVGLALLVGANAAFDLRVLGVASQIELTDLRPLFRVMWVGFWVNFVSGVALFAADATTKGTTPVFMIKLACVLVAVVVLILLRRSVYRDATPRVSAGARGMALVSLVLWLLAITTGRFMAYPELLAELF
jgi:hypothetical protein